MKILFVLLALLVGLGGAWSPPNFVWPGPAQAESSADPALIFAVKSRDTELVRELLAGGAEPESEDWAGWTPLIWASLLLENDIVTLLLDAGADIERIGEGGKNSGTPLMMAAKKHAGAETVQLLLARGARVNGTDQYDRTPLIMAAKYGRMASVKVLLAAGADVTRISLLKSWRSALHAAKSRGHAAVADILVEAGATE